jgi:type I restriction enzyme S subunit
MIGRYGPPIFQILRGIDGAYNVALMKATPIEGVTQNYLYYLLKDPNLLNVLLALSSRSCGQDGIDMPALRNYLVGLPPLNEQERIAKKLDEILPMFDNISF